MLSADQCNGVSELAEGHTYIRGRCKQFGNLYSPNRDDGRCISDFELLVHKDEFGSPVDIIETQTEDICGRVSMTPGDQSIKHDIERATTNECEIALPIANERRLSRDIGVQAFSLEIEEEKRKSIDIRCEVDRSTDTKYKEYRKCVPDDRCYVHHERRPSVFLRRDSCHYHKLISPQNEIVMAHCSGSTPIVECTNSFETFKSHDIETFICPNRRASYIGLPSDECSKQRCYCIERYRESIDSSDTVTSQRLSTCSSDSSTITKIATAEIIEPTKRSHKWKSGLVYFMDPCIEDAAENATELDECTELEQRKPLLPQQRQDEIIATQAHEKRSNYRSKSIDETRARPREGSAVRNVEGIELANDAVCPFGLAKNLEKQICIIPSRKKKSSGRPSFLKLVTFILIGSAILITSAAIKEAYYH